MKSLLTLLSTWEEKEEGETVDFDCIVGVMTNLMRGRTGGGRD
jgi:hypothetical protein